jgi:membrane protein YqaA with SNARE-associated domain
VRLFRRLYEWVLHWAETPYGPIALFLLALAESSFFPIPPDPLLIALCLGAIKKSWRFAFICSLASVMGGAIGYLIGFAAWEPLAPFFFKYVPGFTEEGFQKIMLHYQESGFLYVFLAGFTPIPYKIFTIASGVFKLNFPLFILASAISRSLRFYLFAGLFRKFGPGIKVLIEKYFDRLAWIFLALIVIGFLLMKFLI